MNEQNYEQRASFYVAHMQVEDKGCDLGDKACTVRESKYNSGAQDVFSQVFAVISVELWPCYQKNPLISTYISEKLENIHWVYIIRV